VGFTSPKAGPLTWDLPPLKPVKLRGIGQLPTPRKSFDIGFIKEKAGTK